MAYNTDLECRIDMVTDRIGNILKKKMFSGIDYLMKGNMCSGIHNEYPVLRVSPVKSEKLLRSDYLTPFDITGRALIVWLSISPDAIETEDQLRKILHIATISVEALP